MVLEEIQEHTQALVCSDVISILWERLTKYRSNFDQPKCHSICPLVLNAIYCVWCIASFLSYLGFSNLGSNMLSCRFQKWDTWKLCSYSMYTFLMFSEMIGLWVSCPNSPTVQSVMKMVIKHHISDSFWKSNFCQQN